MARHRWTIVLILVCLPILATVITAFRVNLPKSSQEKLDTKKQHSDVHEYKFGKLNSVKIESAKRSYDDLKKIVREKITETKPTYKVIDISEDGDDDDDVDQKSQVRFKHQEPMKVLGKIDTKHKVEKEIKKPDLIHNGAEDDEGDVEFMASGKQLKTFGLKKKIAERKENTKVQIKDKPKLTYNNVKDDEYSDDDDDDNDNGHEDNDDDDDDDTDDDDDDDDNNDDDDDDEDDDDDNDDDDNDEETDDGFFKMILQTFTSVIEVKETDKTNDENVKKSIVMGYVKEKESDDNDASDDDDDDDDNDDDDDEDDGEDGANLIKSEISKQETVKTETKTLKPSEIKSFTKKPEDTKKETKVLESKYKESPVRKPSEQEKSKVESKSEAGKGRKTEKKEPTIATAKFQDEMEIKSKRQEDSKTKEKIFTSEVKKKEEKPITDSKKSEETKSTGVKTKEEKLPPDLRKSEEKSPTSEAKKKAEKPLTDSKKNEIKRSDSELKKKEEKKIVPEKKQVEDKTLKDTPKEKLKPESIKKHAENDIKRDKSSSEILIDSQEIDTKHETHLEHVTDALRRRHLLRSEFEDFYTFFPTFAPNFSRIHNPECRRHGQILLRQLRGTKLWALNMVDANAKIPSGILQGNAIQLGNFDQCLGSRARIQLETGSVVKVQGKYCLARVDLKAEYPELEVPVHLAQAKNLIKSRIDDPGHFVPRFSTLSWGVCVPAACGPQDVEVVVKDAVLHYQHVSGLVIRVKVDAHDCHTYETDDWWGNWLELPTVLTLSFYAVIILLVLVATVQDIASGRKPEESPVERETDEKKERNQKNTKDGDKDVAVIKRSDGFLNSFSLYRTVNKLVAPGTDDEIPCIHGVRGIATIALLVCHKFLPVAVTPYTNRLKIIETVSSPIWSWCRAGWMYTDCFLLLSGTLTAHRILVDSDTVAPKRLLTRYLRLTPALLAVVLFYAYIWDNISTGPMWGTLVTKNSQICQEGWWWNLLYVQNYFGFEEMCAPQTHQLALDMQLTIFGCLITWAMQVNAGITKLLLPGIHFWAAYSRYTTARDHRLTMLVYHGVSVSQLYRTARLSYTSTLHRSTAYLIGLSLGLALQKSSKIHKLLLILGWIFSSALWGLVWWAGFDSGSTQYRYSVNFAAPYAALAPIASAMAIAWMIYVVHSGHCEFLSRFLCCQPLVVISRLSYALYLCQFIVYFTNVATVRSSSDFTLMSLIDAQEISAIIISSVILTLTLVIPLQSLPKIISFATSTDSKEMTETRNQNHKNERNGVSNKEQKEEAIDVPQTRSRQQFVAHREVLEEIPEDEFEYEMQRDKLEGLEEIIEEEEDGVGEEEIQNDFENEELEIIEEEEGGEEEYWADREEYEPRRSYSEEDRDLDEWEWTANGSGRNGPQYYRYSR